MIDSRLRRTLLTTLAVGMFFVFAGATYQGAATALERRQFPHPGRLVDVGGHQLHIHCTGEGTPTVVLEASAAGMSAAWGWVQPEVSTVTRTCSYDRAGLGWSETGDRPYAPSTAVDELHTLLERAGEHGPYVLVGQGLGASLAVVYASRFSAEVDALVLIDGPSDPVDEDEARSTQLVAMSPWLARMGLLRATGLLSSHADGLPEPARGALGAFLNRPDHLTRAARELARWDEAMRLAAQASPSATRPVVRLGAIGQERVAVLSERDPAMAVTTAIVDLVQDLRDLH